MAWSDSRGNYVWPPLLPTLHKPVLLQPRFAPAIHLISVEAALVVVAKGGCVPNSASPITHQVEAVHILGA